MSTSSRCERRKTRLSTAGSCSVRPDVHRAIVIEHAHVGVHRGGTLGLGSYWMNPVAAAAFAQEGSSRTPSIAIDPVVRTASISLDTRGPVGNSWAVDRTMRKSRKKSGIRRTGQSYWRGISSIRGYGDERLGEINGIRCPNALDDEQ